MLKIVPLKWRESATLMILAKRDKLFNSKDPFDYSALLFKRTEKSTFMPNSYVFPGGVNEPIDESQVWIKHFETFGIGNNKLKELCLTAGNRPNIFLKSSAHNLEREISLRITAIRETFEEVGVLCCRDRKSIDAPNGYGNVFNDFDKMYWQELIHNDSSKFFELCKDHDIVPDLWGLHEWSAWLTPSTAKKRFETAFYLVPLLKEPEVILEKQEVTDYTWKSPMAFVRAHLRKELMLPPPQFYELSRLINITKLAELKKYAVERSSKGTTLMLPVIYACTDGRVTLLPGDDMYPDDPNACEEVITTDMTLEKFRDGVKKLHRVEYKYSNSKSNLLLNFALPNGHFSPVTVNNA